MAKVLGMDGKGGQQPQQKITLEQTTPVTCGNPDCDGDVFFPGIKWRKISRLLTGAPNDQYLPIDVYTCGSCGEILEEMLPQELR